ncbi:hypothetical protein [Achromobacter xylosoxidans]|uniref:hypothetical protein n=1 Tax=Alcaligenes xylosoxydans xylosoxydans TaxID=85698 RepID=UPI000B494BCC|nr:hypothetical protein [Achromobacter xylosoxidans]
MHRILHGGPGDIAPVDEKTTGDRFENAIRAIGAVAACEWFGHPPDSEFTADTIRELRLRSGVPESEA